jgi:hypothetical protein
MTRETEQQTEGIPVALEQMMGNRLGGRKATDGVPPELDAGFSVRDAVRRVTDSL